MTNRPKTGDYPRDIHRIVLLTAEFEPPIGQKRAKNDCFCAKQTKSMAVFLHLVMQKVESGA